MHVPPLFLNAPYVPGEGTLQINGELSKTNLCTLVLSLQSTFGVVEYLRNTQPLLS